MTKLNMDRNRYSIFNSPSSRQSIAKRTDINSGASTPILQAQSFAFVCQHHIVPPVAILLSASSPATVSWFVISRIVNSVKRCASGTISHIFQKCLKRLLPPLAYANTAPAIFRVIVTVAVIAAKQHSRPRAIRRRCRLTMRYWAFSVQCASKATTARTAPTVKASTEHSSQSATVASTVPHGAALLIQTCIVDNSPSTKDVPRQILNTAGGKLDRIGISHVSTPLPERNVVRAASQFELRCRSLLLQNQLAA